MSKELQNITHFLLLTNTFSTASGKSKTKSRMRNSLTFIDTFGRFWNSEDSCHRNNQPAKHSSGSTMFIPEQNWNYRLSKKNYKHMQRLQKSILHKSFNLLKKKKINILQYITVLHNTIPDLLLHVISLGGEVIMDYAIREQLKYLIHSHNICLAFKV